MISNRSGVGLAVRKRKVSPRSTNLWGPEVQRVHVETERRRPGAPKLHVRASLAGYACGGVGKEDLILEKSDEWKFEEAELQDLVEI